GGVLPGGGMGLLDNGMASFRITAVNPSVAHTSDLAALLAGQDWSDARTTRFVTTLATGRQDENTQHPAWVSLPQAAEKSLGQGSRGSLTGTTVLDWFFARSNSGEDSTGGDAGAEYKMPYAADEA